VHLVFVLGMYYKMVYIIRWKRDIREISVRVNLPEFGRGMYKVSKKSVSPGFGYGIYRMHAESSGCLIFVMQRVGDHVIFPSDGKTKSEKFHVNLCACNSAKRETFHMNISIKFVGGTWKSGKAKRGKSSDSGT